MDKFSELKAAAMAATPQKIEGAQEKTEDGCMECPCCSGDGQVDVGADYCNYDNTAIGVIFYGIGDAHVAAERYFRAANAATVLALLAELEDERASREQWQQNCTRAEERISELEAKLATPVRLQSPWVDKVGNRWLLEGTTADVIRAAGFAVTVEGDE